MQRFFRYQPNVFKMHFRMTRGSVEKLAGLLSAASVFSKVASKRSMICMRSLKSPIITCSPKKSGSNNGESDHYDNDDLEYTDESEHSEESENESFYNEEEISGVLHEKTSNSSSVSSGSELTSENELTPCSKKKTLKDIFMELDSEIVSRLPQDIDGLKSYEIKASSRAQLLQKLKDGRPWKRDSRATWTRYDTVRYRDCSGSRTCPNTECAFFQQYKKANKVHFLKAGECKICSIQGIWSYCDARKYTAFMSSDRARVFHHGMHTCKAKASTDRPTDLVKKSIMTDPNTRPSEIQSNAILSDLRNRQDWKKIKSTVNKITNIRSISNEKVTQRKVVQPKGDGYEAIRELQDYVSENDKYLIYHIDVNSQYVLKHLDRN